MNNLEYMREISQRFKSYYDVSFNKTLFNRKFEMFAEFNNRTAKYLLTKKTEIYAFENNEYVFYENVQVLNNKYIYEIRDFIDENIEAIVEASEEHMSSIITFILCGDVQLDEETKKAIKKFKYYKSFFFGLKGWVNAKLIFVNPRTGEIHTNKFGKGDRKKFVFKN